MRHCIQNVKGYLTVARNSHRKQERTQRKLTTFLYETIFIKSSLQGSNNVPLLPFHTRTGDLVFAAVQANAQNSRSLRTGNGSQITGAGQIPTETCPSSSPKSHHILSRLYCQHSFTFRVALDTQAPQTDTRQQDRRSGPNDNNQTSV